MDSFFKAAVCDLDKLLDDFELSAEEHDCKSVFRKPPVHHLSTGSSEASTVLTDIPDLSSLRYGAASSCPDHTSQSCSSEDREVKALSLTGVDLLSSVDCGSSQSSAPPCPDRTLKPVCDLVNDTSSAILVRANSHDAFSELDAAEKQLEEEELLVNFDSPAIVSVLIEEQGGLDSNWKQDSLVQLDKFSSSFSLLDVIRPAAGEKSTESTDDCLSRTTEDTEEDVYEDAQEDVSYQPCEQDHQGLANSTQTSSTSRDVNFTELSESPEVSDCNAETVCGPQLDLQQPGEQSEDVSEDAETDGLSALDVRNEALFPEEPLDSLSQQLYTEGQHPSLELHASIPPPPSSSGRSEPSLVDPPEFGFEYLPESDQAELLVTDEELDTFLQAHAEAEQDRGIPYCSTSVDVLQLHQDVEEVLPAEELRSCGHPPQEDLEGLASPESDRTMSFSAEGHTPSTSQDSLPPCQEEGSHSSTSIPSQSQPSSSSDPQMSYGGARPKQLVCPAVRCPPSAEDEEVPTVSSSCKLADEEWLHTSRTIPAHSSTSPVSVGQEPPEYMTGYDELSEPPPYPGEPSTRSARPNGWKRDAAEELGSSQPAWVPDSEAPNCMNCSQKFTFTKRRHHCRACGKVYCATCCNRKCMLKYLEKEARVCIICFDTLHRAQALERMMSPRGPSPNPNVPSEYCSTIPPLQQARAAGTLNSPPPTVMVPVSVLKHPNNDGCPREHKRVWFADGILPNGEVADTTKLSVASRRSSQEFAVTPEQATPTSTESEGGGRTSLEIPEVVPLPVSGPWNYALLAGLGSAVRRSPSLLPDSEDELPPLLILTGEDRAGDVLVEESPAPCQIRHLLEEGGPRPLTFVLNANLLVNVKLVTYGGRQCWCFGSNGMQALGQRELVFLLECLPEERGLPRDLFTLCLNIQQDAQRGKFVGELDNVTFTSSFLGSKEHAGMLFFSPTCQPLEDLTLPPQPFLFGLLIQKLEVPWAKVFPLRLLLRLGSEYSVYPTAPVSVRFRESVYRETGHTIMNLLADLRNYQYSLSSVEGLRIHMEMGHSYIDIPKSSFNEMLRVVNGANEHVISIAASFSLQADSHLVCFQNEDGAYQTQANSMPGKTRTVTGASFVVFNGALKASSGFIAKSSIVEDGLMVQMPPETMDALRTALREQTDFHITCGKTDGGEIHENVTVRWVDWTSSVNAGMMSGVDGRSLDGVCSVRMQPDAEFECDGLVIRCSEVFYQLTSPDCTLASVLPSCSVFQKEMAMAACSALTHHLAVLATSGINSLSLRVSTGTDMVEYQVGSGGRLLPQHYMNELDSVLIPVIHGGGASVPQAHMDIELLFFITHTI
ncbi:zinc finger FYVE domain-containing protein 16 isoform X2 [Dunckerocampus dactyliophorus]|uniref:zinc finger FYVE domain-containing protein 16 isoform X2 n=1 Tax=Dunckerocampus dactyliophorus TaxID=161453 RepID=UPI0024049A53|nr:zinc finger FYVE domain-containing protein 16 isoform X2 [Dunckerocampus dactyliophorus]